MAEQSPGRTPYAFMRNNPFSLIDPNGKREYDNDFVGPLRQSDWRLAERQSNSGAWNAALNYNAKQGAANEYTSIEQRVDGYRSMQLQATHAGHDVRWFGAAANVASAVDLMEAVPGLGGFANEGNKAIFKDAFEKYGNLMNGPILKGEAADKWDRDMVTSEQTIIDPHFKSLNWLQYQMVDKVLMKTPKDFLGARNFLDWHKAFLPAFPCNRDSRNLQDRIEYGNKLLGRPIPTPTPSPSPLPAPTPIKIRLM